MGSEGNSVRNRLHQLSPAVVLLGVVLVAFSFYLGTTQAGQSSWTPEKAEALQQASQRAHDAVSNNLDPRQREAAMQEFESLQEELDAAKNSPDNRAALFRYLGIGLVVVGAVMYWK